MREMSIRENITLCQLLDRIEKTLEDALPGRYWISAEIGEIKVNASGHCYLDLIDRSEDKGAATAKVQAIIWSSAYRMIRPFFETSTGMTLEKGIRVLVSAQVQYSPLYGLSLIINDIDPSFTIGEQELLRQKTIKQLQEEGMFGINGALEIPPLPRRIAVVSSVNAAGYRDFMTHLNENDYGFNFVATLFSAVMQGESAPASIISALESVAHNSQDFDLVLIIRGGGAAQDLVCFDDYHLAINIAQFPIPVITGIGHDHDFHIADMVAHTSVKTPTAVADFIIDIFAREEQQLDFISRRVVLSMKTLLMNETTKTERLISRIKEAIRNHRTGNLHRMDLIERRVTSASSSEILRRGFSIALKNGRKISTVADVVRGDEIKLIVSDGVIDCTVK